MITREFLHEAILRKEGPAFWADITVRLLQERDAYREVAVSFQAIKDGNLGIVQRGYSTYSTSENEVDAEAKKLLEGK